MSDEVDTHHVTLNEETFALIYQLISPEGPDDGDLIWTRERILEDGIPDSRVWTIIDGEDGSLWCVPGWHTVNRFAYAVSTVSWESLNIEGCYMEGEEHCLTCGENYGDGLTACFICWDTCTDCCDEAGRHATD